MSLQTCPPQPTTTPTLTPSQPQYIIRYTSDDILINGEPVNYNSQILDIDHLYIVSVGPQSELKTPIVLQRTSQVDELDNKIFMNKFIFEIVKAIEICSFEDAAFIIQRVPNNNLKYFVGLVQKVTLIRWSQLLNSNGFYLALYKALDLAISRREMTQLRADYIEEILQTKLLTTYSRLYFLMENLVLEDQNLRNSIVNLTRLIVLKEIQDKNFFEVNIIGKSSTSLDKQEDSQNSGIEDNKSETDSVPDDSEMVFPDKFLLNAIQVVKSCQKLKIQKEIIVQKILNGRFFKILKFFFQNFFERQRCELLEILALASEIEPLNLWKITFEEGRTKRCKSLLYLESLLTNSMFDYSQKIRRPSKIKKPTVKTIKKEEMKENIEPLKSSDCWDFTSVIIEKFITFQSPERKVFLNKILNSLLACRLICEELDFILTYLENTSKDEVYLIKNIEIWKMIVGKIESWLNDLMKTTKKPAKSQKNNFYHQKQQSLSKTMIISCEKMNEIMSDESETNAIPNDHSQRNQPPFGMKLPMSKASMITLMKIYKIFVLNRKKFNISLNISCLMYILDVTERRKGVIEGVRLALMEVLSQEQSEEIEELESYELTPEDEDKFMLDM